MSGRVPAAPFLYAIVDLSWITAEAVGVWVRELASAGAGLIQIRAKKASDSVFLAAVSEGLRAARAHGVPLLVNDRADIARIAGADGVHVGQEDLAVRDVRRLLGRGAIVGLSSHNMAEAQEALKQEIDYLAVGPIFATGSKEQADPAVGTELLRQVRRQSELPLVGIGGIRPENVSQVVDGGAAGVAVISGVVGGPVDGAGERARAYLERMGGAGRG